MATATLRAPVPPGSLAALCHELAEEAQQMGAPTARAVLRGDDGEVLALVVVAFEDAAAELDATLEALDE